MNMIASDLKMKSCHRLSKFWNAKNSFQFNCLTPTNSAQFKQAPYPKLVIPTTILSLKASLPSNSNKASLTQRLRMLSQTVARKPMKQFVNILKAISRRSLKQARRNLKS